MYTFCPFVLSIVITQAYCREASAQMALSNWGVTLKRHPFFPPRIIECVSWYVVLIHLQPSLTPFLLIGCCTVSSDTPGLYSLKVKYPFESGGFLSTNVMVRHRLFGESRIYTGEPLWDYFQWICLEANNWIRPWRL